MTTVTKEALEGLSKAKLEGIRADLGLEHQRIQKRLNELNLELVRFKNHRVEPPEKDVAELVDRYKAAKLAKDYTVSKAIETTLRQIYGLNPCYEHGEVVLHTMQNHPERAALEQEKRDLGLKAAENQERIALVESVLRPMRQAITEKFVKLADRKLRQREQEEARRRAREAREQQRRTRMAFERPFESPFSYLVQARELLRRAVERGHQFDPDEGQAFDDINEFVLAVFLRKKYRSLAHALSVQPVVEAHRDSDCAFCDYVLEAGDAMQRYCGVYAHADCVEGQLRHEQQQGAKGAKVYDHRQVHQDVIDDEAAERKARALWGDL